MSNDNTKPNKRKILGITSKKDENFSDWYVQVLAKAELIEYTDVSGCYVLRPTSCKIWSFIKSYINARLERMGVEEVYFPLFIPEKLLSKEENHIKGFAPEVAWVTHSGNTPLKERIAVRPTSETVIYSIYSKWIQSHRDLPLKLNQWCNVVRWEFKSCVPFLRSREFLWQEGHTVHKTMLDATSEVLQILNMYRDTYEQLLAVPIIEGFKTETEKFAGALFTHSCETFIPGSSKAIQAATSHCLGQNFAKMFDITYEDDEGINQIPWQNSWGFTTRSIGIMIMIHGDDKGLVLPPYVSPFQVVIIPIYKKNSDTKQIRDYCYAIRTKLRSYGIRTHLDSRTGHNPGFLFSEWEMKGVPFQFRIGAKEVSQSTIYVCRRDGKRWEITDLDISSFHNHEIDKYHDMLLNKARENMSNCTKQVTEWEQFVTELDEGNMLLAPFCNGSKCEKEIKSLSVVHSQKEGAAKSLCIPFDQPALGNKPGIIDCINPQCNEPGNVWCLFGRSY